jgi:hypothetical protein
LTSKHEGIKTSKHRRNALGQRRGISSVISATILMGVAVTLGLVLWSNVNAQVATSTQSMTAAATDYVNYVNDRFAIINAAFGHDANGLCSPDKKCVTIWVYNFGERPLSIDSVFFGKSGQPVLLAEYALPAGVDSIPANTAAPITISYEPNIFNHDGTSYDFKVITSGGASHNYYQTDE